MAIFNSFLYVYQAGYQPWSFWMERSGALMTGSPALSRNASPEWSDLYIYIITYVYIYIDNSQVKTLFWTKQSKEFDRIRPNICKIQAFKPKRKMLDLSTKHGHGISFVSGCKFYKRNSSSLWLFTRGQFKVVLLKMMSLPKKKRIYSRLLEIPDCSSIFWAHCYINGGAKMLIANLTR